MNKKNEVLSWYKFGFSDPETVGDGLEEIELLAKDDPEEFQNLIDIFEIEKMQYRKMFLAEILTHLNYIPIKNFYLSLINNENKLEAEMYESDLFYNRSKIRAAGMLLSMNDSRGKDFLKKLVETTDEKHLEWIVDELYEETDPGRMSIMGLECLLELADKHEKIAKRIDHKEVEKLLKRIRSGEKVVWERPPGE